MRAPEITARAAPAAGFSPQLMRAAAVMRMSGASLAEFLRNHDNPYLAVGGLPPPFLPDSSDIRDLLRHRRRQMPPLSVSGDLLDGLIECVGDDGLLDIPDDWLAAVAPAQMESAISYLQSIAPPGVAARDWRECMSLQLAAMPDSPARDAARRLVGEHFPWLIRKRWDKLPKRRLAAAAAALEKLSPCPADDHRPAAQASLPDVVYAKRRGLWRAEAGDGLDITVAARGGRGVATAAQRAEATALAAAVRARRRWLLRVAQLAADRQAAFFGGGAAALRPFSLSEAAAALSVSASFLSHIVSGKAAIFAGGGFPLKYLFPGGGTSVAGAAVQEIIKSMIITETPRRPLSDAALRRGLRDRGVLLARRTVGKHRLLAGFANAALRKQFPSDQSENFYAN